MDRDSTGLQERGLVGPCLGAIRRELLVGSREETSTDALRLSRLVEAAIFSVRSEKAMRRDGEKYLSAEAAP